MQNNELTQHIQDSICMLAMTNNKFLSLVRQSLKPTLLPSFITRDLIRTCYKYYDVAKEAPGGHIVDTLKAELAYLDVDRFKLILSYIERISSMKQPNIDYVISRLASYIKTREFNSAALDFVKLVEVGDFDSAQKLMYDTLRIGIAREDVGCVYFSDYSSIYKMEDDDYLMPIGFKDLESAKVGFKRGEFVCGLGGYKGKKSWFGTYMGKIALLFGLNVLHVTHENSREETEERYDRAFGSLFRKMDDGKELPYYYVDEFGTVKHRFEERPSVKNTDARVQARKIMSKYGGKLIIKKYPPLTCTMLDLEEYLNYLETYENFVPDVLINDYADIMKPVNAQHQTRDILNETYLHHKRLADDRKMLVFTLSQTTRKAIRSTKLKMGDLAEDIRKIANVDTLFGICQDDDQAEASLARIYLLASRTTRMDLGCNIIMNIDFGQFCTETFPIDS